jgi:hypothetical protein
MGDSGTGVSFVLPRRPGHGKPCPYNSPPNPLWGAGEGGACGLDFPGPHKTT